MDGPRGRLRGNPKFSSPFPLPLLLDLRRMGPFRHTSDAPNKQGVVILRNDDGSLSTHPVKSIQSFMIWINRGHGRCKAYFYEIFADFGDAIDQCNKIIVQSASGTSS